MKQTQKMKDNSKRYLVFEKNIHEYVITDSYKDDIRTISLYYSEAEHWNSNVRGTLALYMMIDDDKVSFSKSLKLSNLNQSDLHHLRTSEELDDIEIIEASSSFRI